MASNDNNPLASKDDNPSGISIGKVNGGIHGSIFAARDVSNVTLTVGGQVMSGGDKPTPEQFKELLVEIQQSLAEVSAQKEELAKISASAPFTAQAAEASIKAAAEKVEGKVNEEQAKSAQQSLTEATTFLGSILEGAKTLVEKATNLGRSVKPIAEKLEPLVEKLAVASVWIGKLWLGL